MANGILHRLCENGEKPADEIAGKISIYEMRILRPVNQHVMEEAVRIARKYDITVYDSTYISFAKYLGCPLITADRKLLQKTRMLSHILSIDEY